MMTQKNHLEEAKLLVKMINSNLIRDKEDWLFVESIRARVKMGGFVSEKQIFWLRDIKDRQLDNN